MSAPVAKDFPLPVKITTETSSFFSSSSMTSLSWRISGAVKKMSLVGGSIYTTATLSATVTLNCEGLKCALICSSLFDTIRKLNYKTKSHQSLWVYLNQSIIKLFSRRYLSCVTLKKFCLHHELWSLTRSYQSLFWFVLWIYTQTQRWGYSLKRLSWWPRWAMWKPWIQICLTCYEVWI